MGQNINSQEPHLLNMLNFQLSNSLTDLISFFCICLVRSQNYVHEAFDF